MDIFEYLPQLIVAYDGNDEFANLIHVKKADGDNDYYCPCCGGIVKPRALDSNKEQSHYYHKTGKCTKESQLHFFCKNWLFETGSKFYIEDELFEVSSIEIEESHCTPFGEYRPDITVYTTSGKIIYFEMFFTNRKTGDDYFCKWDALGNDVVEVNIKEYMFKTDTTTIPSFTYLYHNGVCYSKPYVKRDLYANTIAKIKHELTRQKVLNYKARIEQLDWFWQEIRNNTRESILEIVSKMEYEDMVSCYEIIKKKQCVSYLKDDVLNIINQKVVSDVRESLDLPKDETIYFDLRCVRGRTYEAGIRLNLKTEHITYTKLFASCNYWYDFNKLKTFPKVVFNKNIFDIKELVISENDLCDLKKVYEHVSKYKEKLLKYEDILKSYEGDKYKIKMKNDLYTVLVKTNNKFEILFENRHIDIQDIDELTREINNTVSDKANETFLKDLFECNEYSSFLLNIKNHNNINIRLDISKYTGRVQCGIRFKMYICDRQVYDEELKRDIIDFVEKKDKCESIIQDFMKSYSIALGLINKINNCKNNFWKAQFLFDYNGYPVIEIDQKYFVPKKYLTLEKVRFEEFYSLTENDIVFSLKKGMNKVFDNIQKCGYRVMEVCD